MDIFEIASYPVLMPALVDLFTADKVHDVIYTNEIFSMISPEAEKVSLGKVGASSSSSPR